MAAGKRRGLMAGLVNTFLECSLSPNYVVSEKGAGRNADAENHNNCQKQLKPWISQDDDQ
jgi:hypothetical protein